MASFQAVLKDFEAQARLPGSPYRELAPVKTVLGWFRDLCTAARELRLEQDEPSPSPIRCGVALAVGGLSEPSPSPSIEAHVAERGRDRCKGGGGSGASSSSLLSNLGCRCPPCSEPSSSEASSAESSSPSWPLGRCFFRSDGFPLDGAEPLVPECPVGDSSLAEPPAPSR